MTEYEIKLVAALRESVKSLEWAATIIGDIPPKSHYMESLQEARDLIAQAEGKPLGDEPFGFAVLNEVTEQFNSVNCGTIYRLPAESRSPLYTTPQQRKPLTDEQKTYFVQEIVELGTGFVTPLFAIVEAIEKAAHGIKGEK